MNKVEYVAALRELANFVESRDFPDNWRGWYGDADYGAPELQFYVANKGHFGKIISSLGAFKKLGDTTSTDATKRLPLGSIVQVLGKKRGGLRTGRGGNENRCRRTGADHPR